MEARHSKITVALPTCNGAKHLREALISIKAQTDVDFDLLVSDDRSDDETLDIVRDEIGDRARISVNSERLGLAGNWNRCVERSQTEWIAIFHQDDVMHPGHLSRHLYAIEGFPHSRLGLIAGPVVMVDESGQPIPASVVDPGGIPIRLPGSDDGRPNLIEFRPGAWLQYLAVKNPLRCSGVTILKEAHQAVGGFDPAYRYVVDWDFWARIAQDWGMVWFLDSPSVSMRWHPSSETHRFKTGTADLEETMRLLDSLSRIDPPRFREFRPLANHQVARAYLNRAHTALKAGNAKLALSCLDRSVGLDPRMLIRIAIDPRLAVQLATLKMHPELAVQWFAKRGSSE